MRKYRAASKELSEERAREEEIQTVPDFAQRDINECDRRNDIHWNSHRFVQDAESGYRYKECCQPDGEMIVGQT